jgi:hypothetical protein
MIVDVTEFKSLLFTSIVYNCVPSRFLFEVHVRNDIASEFPVDCQFILEHFLVNGLVLLYSRFLNCC